MIVIQSIFFEREPGNPARIEKAIGDVRQSLTIDAKQIEGKLGKHSADIFLAQEAILLDSSVVEELKKILEAKLINAEQVVRTVFRLLARRFRRLIESSPFFGQLPVKEMPNING